MEFVISLPINGSCSNSAGGLFKYLRPFSGQQAGADPEIFKRGGALYVGHHGWLTKKILDFRWSKKAKITLKAISF